MKYTAPAGYGFGPRDQGGNEAWDSDVNPYSGIAEVIALTSGANLNNVDAAISNAGHLGRIGDFVWMDTDRDGLQDVTESGLSGIRMELFSSTNAFLAFTWTDANGIYSFNSLPAGSYKIKCRGIEAYQFSLKNQGADSSIDSDVDPLSGLSGIIDLAPNQILMGVDVGNVWGSFNIMGDRVWLDINENGIQDPSETDLSGVEIELYDAWESPPVSITLSSDDGTYLFKVPCARNHHLKFIVPSGYHLSPEGRGGSDDFDSNVNPVTGFTTSYLTQCGNDMFDIDAGLFPSGMMGEPLTSKRTKATGTPTEFLSVGSTDILIYPNPFSEELTIRFTLVEKGIVRIALFDLTGREVALVTDRVYESGINLVQYRNRSLKPGTYFCRISHPGGTENIKLMISE